jgi:hypothetical protein
MTTLEVADLQAEVTRLNAALNQFNTNLVSQLAKYKGSVDFEIGSMQGDVSGLKEDVKSIKVTVDILNDNIKSEIVKTNDKFNEACAAGGVIEVSVQQIVTQGFGALDFKVKQNDSEFKAVKDRVKQIEDSLSSQGSNVNGASGNSHRGKVLLEYNVINSLQTMSSDKSKYKEWNDKLVNAVTQFRPYARVVLKSMRALKDKEHERDDVNDDVSNESWSIKETYDYDKFNEELYSLLVNKTEGEARSKVMKAGEGQGLEAYRMVNHWFTVTSGQSLVVKRMSIMNPKPPAKEENLVESIESWERDWKEVEELEDEDKRLPEDYKISALMCMLVGSIKEYVISKEWSQYEELRTKVMKWAMVKRASQVHKTEHMEVDPE